MSIGTLSGGLEIWDRRRAGKPQLRSPISWGITGSGALDAAQVRPEHFLSVVCLDAASVFNPGRSGQDGQSKPQLRRVQVPGASH